MLFMQRGRSQRGSAIHTSIPRLSYNPRSKLCYSNFTFSLQKRIVGNPVSDDVKNIFL